MVLLKALATIPANIVLQAHWIEIILAQGLNIEAISHY